MLKQNDNATKNLYILTIILSALYNYFNDPTKLFSDLYLAKLLAIPTSVKLFFPRTNWKTLNL